MIDPLATLLVNTPSKEVLDAAISLELIDPKDRPWICHGDEYTTTLMVPNVQVLCACKVRKPTFEEHAMEHGSIHSVILKPVQFTGVVFYYIGQCELCQTIHHIKFTVIG